MLKPNQKGKMFDTESVLSTCKSAVNQYKRLSASQGSRPLLSCTRNHSKAVIWGRALQTVGWGLGVAAGCCVIRGRAAVINNIPGAVAESGFACLLKTACILHASAATKQLRATTCYTRILCSRKSIPLFLRCGISKILCRPLSPQPADASIN